MPSAKRGALHDRYGTSWKSMFPNQPTPGTDLTKPIFPRFQNLHKQVTLVADAISPFARKTARTCPKSESRQSYFRKNWQQEVRTALLRNSLCIALYKSILHRDHIEQSFDLARWMIRRHVSYQQQKGRNLFLQPEPIFHSEQTHLYTVICKMTSKQ